MKFLVVGSGGREHALCWRLSRDGHQVFCAPGNPGTETCATNLTIQPADFECLTEAATIHGVDLTIVGPEAPLFEGVVDHFDTAGLPIFGPTAEAALLEESKSFAKGFMRRHRIPTAEFRVFEFPDEARDFCLKHFETAGDQPLVIKASGPALGKGVNIVRTSTAAFTAIKKLMLDAEFGDAGRKVVIEQFLTGFEASVFALVNGRKFLPLATAQDFKEAYPGGPMTGGMGGISPHPRLENNDKLAMKITRIIQATVHGMANEGSPYRGFLYLGLMITPGDEPYVLEYNTRLGDPETQVILPRVEGDFGKALVAFSRGDLNNARFSTKPDYAFGFVIASAGYPDGKLTKGGVVNGLKPIADSGSLVFLAGAKIDATGMLVNSGGRVLMPVRLHASLPEARRLALADARQIRFPGAWLRPDIGAEHADFSPDYEGTYV